MSTRENRHCTERAREGSKAGGGKEINHARKRGNRKGLSYKLSRMKDSGIGNVRTQYDSWNKQIKEGSRNALDNGQKY